MGACKYPYATGACNDGDACTTGDACNMGVCSGTPVACTAPPPATCADGNTRRSFSAGGSCSGGTCSYPSSDMACAYGCQAGACKPAPSCGVNGTWTSEEVEAVGSWSMVDPAVAIDAQGGTHVSYLDARQASAPTLRYAYKALGGSWSYQSLGADGAFSGIAIDPAGVVHIVHATAQGDLEQIYRSGTASWSREIIDAGHHAAWPKIVTDPQGGLQIVYLGDGPSGTWLKFAGRPQGATSWTLLDAVATNSSTLGTFGIDPQGGMHVLYTTTSLREAYRPAGGTFTTKSASHPMDPTQVGAMDLAIDSSGKQHLVDIEPMALVYSERPAGGTWLVSTISNDNVDIFVGLALSPQGSAEISYYDSSARQLQQASQTPGPWSFATVDSNGPSGRFNSITVDHQGQVHVIYYDDTSHALRHAVRSCSP
jgi:hypothetical protein